MSEVATPNEATPGTGPSYSLGSVNVDSLKEILNKIGDGYPWTDEASKLAYHEQVAGIDTAGDPHATAEDEAAEATADAEKDAEIADLKAQLAAAQASASAPPAQ